MRHASSLEFISDDQNLCVRIERKEVIQILKICRDSENTEVGGIIVGSYDTAHRFALVKAVSDAPSDSLKGSHWFQRGVKGLQELLNQYWYKKRYFYLGEWHFHPNKSAHVSTLDIEQMTAISISNSYNCPEPILLICGGDPNGHWELCAYVFPRNRTWIRLKELKTMKS